MRGLFVKILMKLKEMIALEPSLKSTDPTTGAKDYQWRVPNVHINKTNGTVGSGDPDDIYKWLSADDLRLNQYTPITNGKWPGFYSAINLKNDAMLL